MYTTAIMILSSFMLGWWGREWWGLPIWKTTRKSLPVIGQNWTLRGVGNVNVFATDTTVNYGDGRRILAKIHYRWSVGDVERTAAASVESFMDSATLIEVVGEEYN